MQVECCLNTRSYSIYFHKIRIFHVLQNVMKVHPIVLNENSCVLYAFFKLCLEVGVEKVDIHT